MWDEMVTTIIIKKENIMVTTSEAAQIDVENSSMIRAPKKQKKEATIKEKREKTSDNLVIKKYPKAFMRLNASMLTNQSRTTFRTTSPLETSLLKG